MKIEITIVKTEDGFNATATSGSFVGKEKFGKNISAEDIGDKIAELVERLDNDGLIGKK